MPFETDQAKVVEYLLGFAEPANARVLDIGCASGRLIRRYARTAKSVVGIDPDAEILAVALREWRRAPRAALTFAQARAEALPFRGESFDAVILAWSL
jgi:ubiquinone/menaquinone biosynthesis C-methylase UbiE